MSAEPPAAMNQRSSMESFLDEYQYVRLGLGILSGVLLAVVTLMSGWNPRFAFVIAVLVVFVAHSIWSLVRGVRTPIPTLTIDLTLWGAVMVSSYEAPIVVPTMFAFLSILPVLFASSNWVMAAFLVYLSGWYGVSFFLGAGFNSQSLGQFLSVLLAIAGLDAVILRIRNWLGRLDANRSQMVGTVSHELKNSLTGMMGMTELVAESDDIPYEEAKELIGLAHQQAVDATEIVEDLLTVSRLERAALTIERRPIDPTREIATAAHRFDGQGATIRLDIDEESQTVEGDPLRVRQIGRNLISNAVRYGGDQIEVVTRSANGQLEVVVRDNGDGVPPDDVGSIFLPYRRSTRTPRTGSSVGLGLWVSRQLAEAMGGTLTYRRVEGWTEFVLAFPTGGGPTHASAASANIGRVAAIGSETNRMLSGLVHP